MTKLKTLKDLKIKIDVKNPAVDEAGVVYTENIEWHDDLRQAARELIQESQKAIDKYPISIDSKVDDFIRDRDGDTPVIDGIALLKHFFNLED